MDPDSTQEAERGLELDTGTRIESIKEKAKNIYEQTHPDMFGLVFV